MLLKIHYWMRKGTNHKLRHHSRRRGFAKRWFYLISLFTKCYDFKVEVNRQRGQTSSKNWWRLLWTVPKRLKPSTQFTARDPKRSRIFFSNKNRNIFRILFGHQHKKLWFFWGRFPVSFCNKSSKEVGIKCTKRHWSSGFWKVSLRF